MLAYRVTCDVTDQAFALGLQPRFCAALAPGADRGSAPLVALQRRDGGGSTEAATSPMPSGAHMKPQAKGDAATESSALKVGRNLAPGVSRRVAYFRKGEHIL